MQNDVAWNQKFTVTYSMCYEKALQQLYSRLDKALSFILLVLSSGVIAQLNLWSVALGLVMAIITAFQFVYSPGQKASFAKFQFQAYKNIFDRFNELSEDQIWTEYKNITRQDTDEIQLLSHCARLTSLSMLGHKPDELIATQRRFTRMEKFFAFLSGENPECEIRAKQLLKQKKIEEAKLKAEKKSQKP